MSPPFTQLLIAAANGDENAQEQFLEAAYPDLRQMARRYLRRERPGHTLQSTGLVNELYLRLSTQRNRWQSRDHFYGVAAYLMQLVLKDHRRKKKARKRGGDWVRASVENLDQLHAFGKSNPERLTAFALALQKLEARDPRAARVFQCRAFQGLTAAATCELLEISERTVKDDWAYVKAFFKAELLPNS